jgi:hypothetical protein
MVVGVISVVMAMIVAIVMMVVRMMITVPRCGWNRAAGYYCADNA